MTASVARPAAERRSSTARVSNAARNGRARAAAARATTTATAVAPATRRSTGARQVAAPVRTVERRTPSRRKPVAVQPPTSSARRVVAILGRARFAAYVGVVAFALFAVVASYAYLAQTQFRVSSLQKQQREAQRTYEQLRLDVAELTAPERIVSSAQRLGMIQPERVTYLQVTEPLPTASDPTAAVLSDGWTNVKADLGHQR
jgi:cell division protein FtsL